VLAEVERDNALRAEPGLLAAAQAAVADLEAAGVLGIVSGCTFLAELQPELAAAARVPLLSSSLLLLPLLHQLYGGEGQIGLLTARSGAPRPELLAALGAATIPIVAASLDGQPEYRAAALEDAEPLDSSRLEAEVVAVASELVAQHPDLRALLLEPTDLPPYARAIQLATGRPVFDVVTQADMLYASLRSPGFQLPDLQYGPAWWRAPW
jgi:hypothetical protein